MFKASVVSLHCMNRNVFECVICLLILFVGPMGSKCLRMEVHQENDANGSVLGIFASLLIFN